ncbi:hypothetical protein R0131_02435 [Clostridium sp. AL.422]|uniref:hypothetical protein n=1 Tax=Clostridium TaxID=1485 RepID=UPI00293DADAB|nr:MULTISPECIES: hypothetical protein [unclassified Clostridium]MDV4149684.1 hypothetical protein [Clostridium sp. AL.422]
MLPIFIFILGILLILLNFRAIKKEDKSFEKTLEREENNNSRDYDVEIITIRKDMAETVLELQREIEDLRLSVNSLKKSYIEVDNKNCINDFNGNQINVKEDVISSINFSNKIEGSKEDATQSEKQKKVKKLLDKGLSDDEICKKLSIGKGEILLIKSLLRK